MEEIINVCINNGIGVASFIALVCFGYKLISSIDITLREISTTLVSVKESLNTLSSRVDVIEDKIKGD